MKGHVAVVTGGTRGIGLGIAKALAAEGWQLALCGVRSEEDAGVREAVDGFEGARPRYFQADVSQADDRRRLLDGLTAAFPRVNALVNNAGRAPRVRADLLEAGEESFDELIRTNLQGPYFLTQALARGMVTAKQADPAFRGAIVFITSVSAALASTNRGDYCVSKAGLSMAAQLYALRLAPEGIPVYEVRPGIIDTDMTAGVREIYDKRITDGLVPERRWGTPADVGRVVASLLRGDAPYATGSIVDVDGGLSIGRL